MLPRGRSCFSLVSVVRCQIAVSATGRRLVQRMLTERGVTERGVTECGVTERGVTERVVTERGVTECDLESSVSGSGGLAHQGCRALRKKLYGFVVIFMCLSFI
jgi:hypothetical protein